VKKLIEQRDSKAEELNSLVVEMEDMSEGEDFDKKLERSNELLSEIKELDEKISDGEEMRKTLKEVEESRSELGVDEEVINDTPVEVNEPDLYREGGEHSFFTDAYRAQFLGDSKAQKRLNDHQSHESRDIGTSALTGMVVPQYLLNDYAPIARAGTGFYNAVPKRDLPEFGNQIQISRITTGSEAAAQATENSAVQETNIDDTLLTVNVNTIAGQQDVSKQLLERGGGPGVDVESVIFGDLAAAYYSKLDEYLFSGTGANGQPLGLIQVGGIGTVTYTDASPTVAELMPKIADLLQGVNSDRFAPASAILMHPRRWGFITAGVDGNSRPLVLPAGNAPSNAQGVGEAAAYGNVVGSLMGVPVITDANVQTNTGAGNNEDLIYAVKMDDLILWESPLFQAKFEETNAGSLTTKIVVYGYAAFGSGRYPAGISYIGGTGNVTPTF
tara:strand:+ start:6313 stop:7644 length:1332 start_codon:yes stop_codon:yes gene_type:complete